MLLCRRAGLLAMALLALSLSLSLSVAASAAPAVPLQIELTNINDLSQMPLEQVSLRQQQAAIDRWIDTAVSHSHAEPAQWALGTATSEAREAACERDLVWQLIDSFAACALRVLICSRRCTGSVSSDALGPRSV
jgi:hypothetical protein